MTAGLAASLLLAAPDARAGTYSAPVYSGGTLSDNSNSSKLDYPFAYQSSSQPPAYQASASGYSRATAQGQAATATVSVSGPLTAKFTWQPVYPGEPAPASVIVLQQASASVYCQSQSPASTGVSVGGSCADGLGGSGSGCPSYTSTTTYTVMTPAGDGSVTLKCSPSATFTVSTGTGNATGDVFASYSVNVYPVTISLVGQNASYQALCGQQITASLNCPLGKVTSYNWAVSGNLIKTYNPSFGTGQVVSLSSNAGDFTGSKLYFYDVNNNDTASATCYANVTLPDGTAQIVSATSPTVTFRKPTAPWWVKEGYIQPFTVSQYPGSTLFGLAADPSSKSTYPNGEDWFPVDITMPSGFPTSGQCGFTQLATPNHTFTRSGTTTGGPRPQGLDNTFGFGGWTLPGQGNSGDNPSLVTNSGTNSGLAVNDQNSSSDKFTTYLMYMPPAFGSQGTIWVSLETYDWFASTTIVWNGSQWQVVPASSSPNSPSPVAVKGNPTDTLPTWNTTYVNSQ